jgi:hypothetical protein
MDVQRNAKKFKLQEDHQQHRHQHLPDKQIKPPSE